MATSDEHAPHEEPPGLAAARDTISGLMARYAVTGLSLAVTDSAGLLHAAGFGFRDLGARTPATADTAYLWFSMSKIATATAAMRLADEGRLDLDAPVGALVPACTAARSEVQPRIRDLLRHTAGLANPLPVRWVLPAGATDAEARAAAAALVRRYGPPRRAPGGPARYSNIGYLVLAEAIAAASGGPFEDHVHRAVLDPAGMSVTGYTHRGENRATGYVRLPRGLGPALSAGLPRGVVGSRHGDRVGLRDFRVAGAGYGGLIGSAVDAARLVRLHLGDGAIDGRRILRSESARTMREVRTPGRPFDLGLGWFRRPADRAADPAFVEHWGTGGGFWNAMRLYPGADLGIVVMANTTHAYGHHTLMDAVRRAFRP